MDRLHLTQHISGQFNAELEEIRRKVLAMGGLVEAQLGGAVEALQRRDGALAARVAAADKRIDEAEMDIDNQCTHVLARRQPAASDLRLIMSVIKTISDLERIGDEAERVSRMVERVVGEDVELALVADLAAMGTHARGMLRGVLDAFARADVDAAITVVRADRQLDQLYERFTADLTGRMMANPACVPVSLNLIWASRSMERIGDRCKNIAEYVAYLVDGKDVRHQRFGREPKPPAA